jgi:thymidylate kinase
MIVVLNGPLGIGKSTLAEALSESMDYSVMLDGDHMIAANPRAGDEREHLHSTLALLVAHHRRFGYRSFVINHIWTSLEDLADLRARLASVDDDFHVFLLTLSLEENLRRIAARASVRALDEREFEQEAFAHESRVLAERQDVGERFDVSEPPPVLVERMLRRLGVRRSP